VASIVIIISAVGVLWIQGERSPWSPDFTNKALPPGVVNAAAPELINGAQLFHTRGCENCHAVAGYGGHRGPDLSTVGDRMTKEQITLRILNGAYNMPAFASSLKPEQVRALVTFLESRTAADRAAR
jgi:ubiquinol-cytochrome c reductase cytochrome b subunit